MGKAGLFMKPWHMNFKPTAELPTMAPVWIRLHDIPLELWKESVFEAIGSSLGEFISASNRTQTFVNISYARICVNLSLLQPLPEQILVQDEHTE